MDFFIGIKSIFMLCCEIFRTMITAFKSAYFLGQIVGLILVAVIVLLVFYGIQEGPQTVRKLRSKITKRSKMKKTLKSPVETTVNENTTNFEIPNRAGTWRTIGAHKIGGKMFYLMKTNYHPSDISNIIVDENGVPFVLKATKGFDEDAFESIKLALEPVEKMPDDSISIKEMKEYGYVWGGMLPLRAGVAKKLFQKCEIFVLHNDDTESVIDSIEDIDLQNSLGCIFGIEKKTWEAYLAQNQPSINVTTDDVRLPLLIGRWCTIDSKEIDSKMFFIMRNTYFEEEDDIIVDENGTPYFTHVRDGFDDYIVEQISLALKPIKKLPDDSISIEEMRKYGYLCCGMLPISADVAKRLFGTCCICALYRNDCREQLWKFEDIEFHEAAGGMFGIEREDWIDYLNENKSEKTTG